MTTSQILAIVISTMLVGLIRENRHHYYAFKERRRAAEIDGTATHLIKSGHLRLAELALLLAFWLPVCAVIVIAIADGYIGSWYE